MILCLVNPVANEHCAANGYTKQHKNITTPKLHLRIYLSRKFDIQPYPNIPPFRGTQFEPQVSNEATSLPTLHYSPNQHYFRQLTQTESAGPTYDFCPCNNGILRRFGEPYWFHLQGNCLVQSGRRKSMRLLCGRGCEGFRSMTATGGVKTGRGYSAKGAWTLAEQRPWQSWH
jgi:hypothetical protein